MKNKTENRIAEAAAGEGGFENRPFRMLDSGAFPKLRSAVRAMKAARKELDEAPDRELFLRAVEKLKKEKVPKKNYGFLLGAQCDLPQPKQAEKKLTEKKPAPPKPCTDKEEGGKNEFLLAVRNTEPLAGKGRQVAKIPERRQSPVAHDPDFAGMLAESLKFTLLWSDEYLEGRVTSLDDMIMNRLREGQMSPEAHLDLHGLNALQAFENLKFFIRDSWYKGLRVVLVVTGRGLNSPSGQSILRRKAQSWLTQEPLKRVVLAFCTAMPHDGGPGSIYVLLRRYRKKGQISWDRLPADADLY